MTSIVYPDADQGVIASLRRTGQWERLANLGTLRSYPGDPTDDDEFLERVGDADVVLLGSNLPDRVLTDAPHLALVSFTGYGAANFVNLPLASQRGIAVANTPGYGAASVAEHALALALAVAHRIPVSDAGARHANWTQPASLQLAGKTAGVIGYGAIGRRAAELFSGIGMNVLVWARRHPDHAPRGVEFVALDELLVRSDIVSIHLALTPETAGFITAAHLAALRHDAIIVNTARAELIEPGALEAALSEHRIRAGLDVFTREPIAPDSAIATLPGTVLTPHQGYNTPEALDSLLTIAVDNIDRFLSDRPYHSAHSA